MTLPLLLVAVFQHGVAERVDQPRHALAALIDRRTGLRIKQGRITAGHLQSMPDIFAGLLLIQCPEVMLHCNSLCELPHIRLLQDAPQFRLPNQHDLEGRDNPH